MTNEFNKNVIRARGVVENHDLDKSRQGGVNKNRGTSKDRVTSLNKKMVDVETSVIDFKAQMEDFQRRLEAMDFDFADTRDNYKGPFGLQEWIGLNFM